MKQCGDTVPEIEKFLCTIPLFLQVSESCVKLLARTSRFQKVDEGENLFFQN